MRHLLTVILLVALALQSYPVGAGDAPALVLEKKIPLGDIGGRIDHLAYDAARQRLYVAELGNDSIGIVDLTSSRLIRTVTGFEEPQGLAYEQSTDTVYVANGGNGSLQLFRGEDFTPVETIALGADADNVRVDSATHRIFVGYGSGAIAVIDAISRKRIANIPMKTPIQTAMMLGVNATAAIHCHWKTPSPSIRRGPPWPKNCRRRQA